MSDHVGFVPTSNVEAATEVVRNVLGCTPTQAREVANELNTMGLLASDDLDARVQNRARQAARYRRGLGRG